MTHKSNEELLARSKELHKDMPAIYANLMAWFESQGISQEEIGAVMASACGLYIAKTAKDRQSLDMGLALHRMVVELTAIEGV